MARKRNNGNLQLEESEAETFNGNTNVSGQKETSPETSVLGTESEGSPPEKFRNINSEHFKQPSSLKAHDDSQNIMRSVLGLDPSPMFDLHNSQKGKEPDVGYNQTYTNNSNNTNGTNNTNNTNNGFDHSYSYFSTSLPLGHSPHSPLISNMQPDTIMGSHSSNHLSYYKSISGMYQQDNSTILESSTTFNSRTKPLVNANSVYSNTHSTIDNRDVTDITAPKPIHANTNVAVAVLAEQPHRRDSLLSLFTASTSTRKESSIHSKSIDDDTQRKNSLLSVLKSETPVSSDDGRRKNSLTHEDIVQHQRQQHSLFHYPPNSYNSVNPLDGEMNVDNQVQDNNGMFTMFQNSISQGNTLFSTSTSNSNNDSNLTISRRDSTFSRHSNQDVLTQKLPINVGHVGQGRPSINNDTVNQEVHEVARKISLLGLSQADYSLNDTNNGKRSPSSVENSSLKHQNHQSHQNTFFSTPVVGHERTSNSNAPVNNEPLMRLIAASPSPSGNNFYHKAHDPEVTEIHDQERNLLDLLKLNSPPNREFVDANDGKISSYSKLKGGTTESSASQKKEFSSGGGYGGASNKVEASSSLDQRARHEFYALIPPGDSSSSNPMSGFKFDVEKIISAL